MAIHRFAALTLAGLLSYIPISYSSHPQAQEKGTIGFLRPITSQEAIEKVSAIMDGLTAVISAYEVNLIKKDIPQAPVNHDWTAYSPTSTASVSARKGLIPGKTTYAIIMGEGNEVPTVLTLDITPQKAGANPGDLEKMLDSTSSEEDRKKLVEKEGIWENYAVRISLHNSVNFFIQGSREKRMFSGYAVPNASGNKSNPLKTIEIERNGRKVSQTYTSDGVLLGEFVVLELEEIKRVAGFAKTTREKFPLN